MSRVIVFGLDAGSLPLIQRWQDDLPTLSRLMREGTSGILHSTIPPFTSPAWACMATGKNPAKMGIFGLRQRQKDTYQFAPPTSAYRHAPAVWDLASQAGLRVVCVNVPDTYPPSPINGVMVSGRPATSNTSSTITHPPELQSQLNKVANGYLIGPTADFEAGSQADELDTWRDVSARQQVALEYLMTAESWDLFFYVSMAVDGICHHFWQYLDPKHPQYEAEQAAKFGDVIRQTYMMEDARLAKILPMLREDDLLLVVSDHGSTPCYNHIAVNSWLIEKGYLVLQEGAKTQRSGLMGKLATTAVRLYRRSEWIRALTRPFRQTNLRNTLVQANFQQKTGGRVPFDSLAINWDKTTAYYLGDDRLYLNVAGREPKGTVQPGTDYETQRERLKADLLVAQDEKTGKRLFTAVYTREEIYSGPYLEQAPDLILVPGDIHWNLGGAVGETIVDRPVVGGKHHPEGVFIAWGKDIQAGQRQTANIYDIAPTILHVLNLSVPEDVDGRVQLNWFEADSAIAQRPIQTAIVSEIELQSYEWADDEKEQVEARLRELGYLD